MHAYIQFPGLHSKACSSYSPLLGWGCGGDSSLFWFVWFLKAGGVGWFFCCFVGWDFFFSDFGGGVWLAGLRGLFVWLVLVCFLVFFCCCCFVLFVWVFLFGLSLFFNA